MGDFLFLLLSQTLFNRVVGVAYEAVSRTENAQLLDLAVDVPGALDGLEFVAGDRF